LSKITLNPVGDLTNTTTAANTININSATVQTAIDNTLSRDGTSPNQMTSSLDLSGNQVLNLPAPATANSPLRLQDLNSFIGGGTVTNIPTGGTTGQLLGKNSNTNFDVGYRNVSQGLVAGTNIAITGTTPATISMSTTPTLGATAITSASASALAVGVNGATNPSFVVNDSVASQADGLSVTGTISGSGVAVATISPATNSPMTISTKGTGTLFLQNAATGPISLGTAVTAPSINGNAITTGTGTLTLGAGKTLANTNSLTLAGTDATTITFQGTDTYVSRTSTDTLSNKTLVTPVLGVATATSINKVAFTAPTTSATLTIADGTTLTETTSTSVGKGQYLGTSTNDNATAGNIGEYVSSTIASGSAISITSGTPINITSISLTAGDWDVTINTSFHSAASTNTTILLAGISTTTGALNTNPGFLTTFVCTPTVMGSGADITLNVPPMRLSLSGTTTVFLVAEGVFTVSTMTSYGIIQARRAR